MPKNSVLEWSTTASDNLDVAGVDISEGCASAGINNAIRALMAQVKGFFSDPLAGIGTAADKFLYSTAANTWAEADITAAGRALVAAADADEQREIVSGVPAGAVMPFAMATAPTGWLECDGTAVSRTTYATLFAAIGTTYGVGDGSTTFNLPEMRAEFPRGWDNGRGVDVGRALGSFQNFALQEHSHDITGYTLSSSPNDFDYIGSGANESSRNYNAIGDVEDAETADETRPRNVALLYCIKS